MVNLREKLKLCRDFEKLLTSSSKVQIFPSSVFLRSNFYGSPVVDDGLVKSCSTFLLQLPFFCRNSNKPLFKEYLKQQQE